MKLLITGGAGFIGRYFFEVLSGANAPAGPHDITILDLVKPGWDLGAHRALVGDIRDAGVVRRALDGRDAVLHLAAAHHDFGIAHDTYYDVNENGAKVLCAAMDERGITNLCFFSSVAVYGDTPEPHYEDSPKHPTSPYGGSKLAAEKVFETWTATGGGRSCLVIRPTVTFGPRNVANMYSLIRQIYSGKFFQVGDGGNIKSLSYVENIVEAAMFLWTRGGRKPFDVVNFIDKPDLTSGEITATIYAALGRGRPLKVPMGLALLGALPFDMVIKLTGKNLPVSSARVKKLFAAQTKFEADKLAQSGFKSRIPLREGITKMVQWYEAEGRHAKPVWRTPPAAIGGEVGYTGMGGKQG